MSSKGLITRAALFNRAAPGANTNILTSNITPAEGSAMRVSVVLATASVFNTTITDGTTTFTCGLNASVALTAGDMYFFEFACHPSETNSGSANALGYNFQVETDGIIRYLVVEEAQLGTA